MTSDRDTPDIAAGHWLFTQGCEFARGIKELKDLPKADRAEVAFAGRSNVGKSSLLNALAGRKNLARTSNTPGRTREINFFTLPADRRGLYLVDLPGFGYAKVAKAEAGEWNRLVSNYLRGRASLRRAFLLVDARHGPGPGDEGFMTEMDEAAVSVQLVITKSDKVKASELDDVIEATREAARKHVSTHPRMIATSSETKSGIEDLRAEIAGLIDLAALGYKGRV